MASRSGPSELILRGFSSLALLVCIASFPQMAHAANNCPWLTEATASGLIGADATGTYTAASGTQPAVCVFIQNDEGMARSLTITVEIAKQAHARMTVVAQACGSSAARLNAIGNEAVYCDADTRRNELAEQAVGRVRDQVFTIVLKTRMKDDPILTRDTLNNRIYTAAEQVAGNLF